MESVAQVYREEKWLTNGGELSDDWDESDDGEFIIDAWDDDWDQNDNDAAMIIFRQETTTVSPESSSDKLCVWVVVAQLRWGDRDGFRLGQK